MGPQLLGFLNSRHGLRGRRFWLVLSLNLVGAVLSVLFLLVVLTRPLGSPRAPILILGEGELRAEAARMGLPEGREAPGLGVNDGGSLGLTDLDGSPMDLEALAGRPVWIVFWATYCHACQEEEPDLRRVYHTHRADGLVVLAIDAGEPAEDVRRYGEERQLPWNIALDPELQAYDAHGAIGTPTHYFIDREGRIASRGYGRLELAEMEARVAQILGDDS